MSQTNYRELEGISQSLLKKLPTCPKDYAEPKEFTADYLKFGTMVDVMVKSNERFNKKYSVMTASVSDAIKAIVEEYYNTYKDVEFLEEDALIEIGKNHNYDSRIKKKETYLAKLKNSNTLQYILQYSQAESKEIITQEEYNKVSTLVQKLLSDSATSFYCRPNYAYMDDLVIQFTMEDRLCKAELDRIIIDNENKNIIPVDFKTTSSSYQQFIYSFFKYGYHIQGAWYTEALKEWLKTYNDGQYAEYTILSFVFIVAESSDYNPKVYTAEITEKVLNAGYTGFTNKNGYFYEGIEQLFERLDFHEIYGFTEFPMEHQQNGNCLKIDLI